MSYDDPRFSRLDPWSVLHAHLARLLLRKPDQTKAGPCALCGKPTASVRMKLCHRCTENARQNKIRAERVKRAGQSRGLPTHPAASGKSSGLGAAGLASTEAA